MQIDYELEQFSPVLPINQGLSSEELLGLFEEYIRKLSRGEEVITRKNKIAVQIYNQEMFREDILSEAFLGYFYNGIKLGYLKFPEMIKDSKFFSKLCPGNKQKIKEYIEGLLTM
jgi:hypothetical protein